MTITRQQVDAWDAEVNAAYERGRQEGMKQERALWTLTKVGQEIEAQPAQVSEYECRKLLYGFMLDCNAVGLEQAGKNLHRSMKEKTHD
jgi:hypothetical protein